MENSSLQVAHWGMYAGGPVDHGIQYNDDIKIWTLDAPSQTSAKPVDLLGSHEKWQRANKNMRRINTLFEGLAWPTTNQLATDAITMIIAMKPCRISGLRLIMVPARM